MNNNSVGSILMQLVLEAGVPSLGKNAVPIYSIAKNVSNSNKFSPEAKAAAGFIAGGALLLVGILYFDKVVDYLNS